MDARFPFRTRAYAQDGNYMGTLSFQAICHPRLRRPANFQQPFSGPYPKPNRNPACMSRAASAA